ncbi:Chitinase A1 precursor [compost metagenome]
MGGGVTPPVDTIAPTAPTSVTASSKTSSSVTLTWQPSTDNVGVVGYNVYRNGAQAASVSGTTATIGGLAPATTYSFTVVARDAVGNVSPASAPLSVTTDPGTNPGDTTAPTAPGNVTVTAKTSSSVSLSWSASSDNVGVTGYEVYNGNQLATTVSGTMATLTGLAPSTTYTFTVKAKDAAGNSSAASSAVTATTDSTGTGPATWAPYTAYTVNQLVTYNGVTYKVIQAHTSLPGWEPDKVPALFQAQ